MSLKNKKVTPHCFKTTLRQCELVWTSQHHIVVRWEKHIPFMVDHKKCFTHVMLEFFSPVTESIVLNMSSAFGQAIQQLPQLIQLLGNRPWQELILITLHCLPHFEHLFIIVHVISTHLNMLCSATSI